MPPTARTSDAQRNTPFHAASAEKAAKRAPAALRTPGDGAGYAAYIANGWGVTNSGEKVSYESHGVRPVIMIEPKA
ncbi:MAG: hypothetical protein IKZ82_13580 [Clostridia bacterium]|nr:hypothetical protein [Clostridia bacterium]